MAIRGQLTLNEIALLGVDVDPSTGGGLDARVGTVAFLDDGTGTGAGAWIKYGAGVTAWARVSRQADGTTFTAGSVAFFDANGLVAQNNASFFWDNGTGRLGLGTAVPATRLHVDGGNGVAAYGKWTAGTTTGITAADGFDVGVAATGVAEVRQRENLSLLFYTNDIRRLGVISTGQVAIGSIDPVDITGGGLVPAFQIIGSSATTSQMASLIYSADATGAFINLAKSRGALGAHLIVNSGDEIGRLQFRASDGGIFRPAAYIRAVVDAAPTVNTSMPGRIEFFTTPTGAIIPLERMKLDSEGRLIIGTGATAQDITGTATFPAFQIQGTVGANTQMAAIHFSADTIPPVFNLLKSRGALNAQGLLSSGDELGRLQFRGSDGVNFQAGASVRAAVDGVAAAGSMPGRLLFLTTPTGTTTPVERMRIDSAGIVIVAGPIRIGTTADTTDGNMRYSGTDFEGRMGGVWRSLTGAWISYNVEAIANITITSATDVLATGMAVTPAAGIYLVHWGMQVSATSNNRVITASIYVNGVKVANSQRQAFIRTGNGTFTAADIASLNGSTKITVNGTDVVDIRWNTNGGTAQAQGRNLTLCEMGS